MSQLTISEVFDLPNREDITALGFVVRLTDEEDARLAADYVVTPAVASELPAVLSAMRHAFKTRGDLGRFVHGSFGSGKSHFLSFLGMLLEGRKAVWNKDDATVKKLAPEHRPWLEEANLLVVRLHMLTVAGGRDTGLDRAVYDAANAALAHRGKAPFEFLHVQGVLDEARREATLFGARFWEQMEKADVVGSAQDFEAMAGGPPEDREALARAYLKWKGRDGTTAGVDPNWSVGLRKLCTHVKGQGYGGVALLIDELLLWLREKSGPEFERAINQLNTLVDHADGARELPLFVFVAQQRNIEEFFPDLVEERQLHEHLGHHAKRFELISLEDVELRHVCKGRVLRPRPERAAELARVVEGLARIHEKVLPAVLQQADMGYLRDVYPFHPALIEMLIDVSSLMQRDRTALRLLYELLVIHYPDLPLGKLLPVGAAFDAIFPEAGVDGSKRQDDLRAIHRTYYLRFRPAMDAMLKAPKDHGDFDAGRRRVLETIVKTALLAKVSPRLSQSGGMSVDRLVRLNDSEVIGETDRAKFNRVYQDLLELSRMVPGTLQLTGTGREASVSVVLQGVNFGEMLERARARLSGQKHPRLQTFYAVLLPALDIEREDLDGKVKIDWRKTGRYASIDIQNIRNLANAAFKPPPGTEVRVLVDYPWDEPGYSVADDEQRARDVQRRDGRSLTICWLPRHFTPAEMGFLDDLAAHEELLGPASEEMLRDLAPNDRALVMEHAHSQAKTLRDNLANKLGEVYRDHGRIVALRDGIDAKVPGGELKQIWRFLAAALLDQQYPDHPRFTAEPKPEGLRLLCDFMARAAEAPDHRATYTDDEAKVLRTLGEPMELVTVGQSRASLRLDTGLIKTVRELSKGDSVSWEAIDQKLQGTYALTPAVRTFFLKLLVRLDSFRAIQGGSGDPVDIEIDNKPRSNVTLKRAPLLDLAAWSLARELGPALLGVKSPSTARTLAEQDRYANELHQIGSARRTELSGLYERLVHLGAGDGARAERIKTAMARLLPLVTKPEDSSKMLGAWLAVWPNDMSDPLRAVVARQAETRAALDVIDGKLRNNLLRSTKSVVGSAVIAHLDSLRELLMASEEDRPLAVAAIKKWNHEGETLFGKVLEELEHRERLPQPVPVPVPQPGPEPSGKTEMAPVGPRGHQPDHVVDIDSSEDVSPDESAERTLFRAFRASDASERQALFDALKKVLDEAGSARLEVRISLMMRSG